MASYQGLRGDILKNSFKYRFPFENEDHWFLRRQFLVQNCDKFPMGELVSLSRIFLRITFLGHRFDFGTMKMIADMTKGIVGLSQRGGTVERQKKGQPEKANQSDPPPDSLVKKNIDSSSTSSNTPSTITSQTSCEQSSKIAEATNPNQKLSESNVVKPQSKLPLDSKETNKEIKGATNNDKDNAPLPKGCNPQSAPKNTSSANPAPSINTQNLFSGDKLNRSGGSIAPESDPFQSATAIASEYFTTYEINQLKTLSENSKDKGLIEKLTDISKWLKIKKNKINEYNASEFLKSAMNFFNLNLSFQRLPEIKRKRQKILLFCSLGHSEVLLSIFVHKFNEIPEQKVCLKAFEKLCQPGLTIQSGEPDRPDLLVSEWTMNEGGKPPRYRSFVKRQRYGFNLNDDPPEEVWTKKKPKKHPPAKTSYFIYPSKTNSNQSGNFVPQGFNHPQSASETCSSNAFSFSSQNPSNITTPGNVSAGANLSGNGKSTVSESIPIQRPTPESFNAFIPEDLNQLKMLSLNLKHSGFLSKLTALSKWLKEKKSDINKFCISELLKYAMGFFDLNLLYKRLPEGKIMLVCTLGSAELLLCSTEFTESENPEEKACLRAVDKLCQPYLGITSEHGRTDLLITSDFPIPGADIPNDFAEGLSKSKSKRLRWIMDRTKRQQAEKARKKEYQYRRMPYSQPNPNAMLRYLNHTIDHQLPYYGAW